MVTYNSNNNLLINDNLYIQFYEVVLRIAIQFQQFNCNHILLNTRI